MSRTVDMTVGSPTRHLLKFAFPLIVTNIGQQLYMIADASIVGRGVGVKALASVGATDWIYWMILWAGIGLTQGFSTFVARFFGEKNYRDLNKSIGNSIFLCAVIGIILTLGGILSARPLLELLGTPDDILDGATLYLVTMISGTLVVIAYNMSASVLRAFGDGKSPLIAMIIAAALNIGLDCLFVFVFKWGIFGAAIASIIAQLVSFLFCLVRIRRIEYVKLDREALRFDFKMMKELLLFGLPIAFEYMIIAVGGIILQSSVNLQGSIFIAGYTATNKVYGLLESSAISLGLAASTFLSQNYGAGLYDRFKRGVRASLAIVTAMAFAVMTLAFLLKDHIMRLFIDTSEVGGDEALGLSVQYFTILASCLLILYLIHVFRNALQAMEISVWSMISGLVECGCRIFMAKVILSYIGRDALFIAEPVAWLGALACVGIPYLFCRQRLKKESECE